MKYLLPFILGITIGIVTIIGIVLSSKTNLPKSIVKPIPSVAPFLLEKAPTNSQTATVTSLTGEVAWQSRTATEASNIKTLSSVQQGEKIETKDTGKIQFEYKTIGTLTVLPKTSLSIIQTLPVSFVFLLENGTITFSQESQTIPFEIRALHLLFHQEGGASSITVNPDTSQVIIHVTKGSGEVAFNNADQVTTTKTISQSETFQYDDETRLSTIY